MRKCCTVATREVVNGKSVVQNLEFADYDPLEDSWRDYAWVISNDAPFRAAWERYHPCLETIASAARLSDTART
jgi:flagellum-specific peptidoglycan hydrolase FlgJ